MNEYDQILSDALQLSDHKRGELAAVLIESLVPDADSEQTADQELLRRIDELEQGVVQAIPWSEARRMILEDADEPGSH